MKIKNGIHVFQGFTLIELLVVIVTMTVIFTVGYANYSDFSRRKELEGWKIRIVADLRLAQQYASAGRKPAGCSTLDGYEFEVVTSLPQNYSLEARCNGVPIGANTKTVNLPTHIVITSPTPNPIIFKVLEQGTNLPGASTTFNLQAYGITETVTVSAGGEIY